MGSKDDWKARFDNPPVDKEKQEAFEKAQRVVSAEMAELQNHPGWVRLKNHQEVHSEKFVAELAELQRVIMLVLPTDEMRGVQLKYAYRKGYMDGMATVMNGPSDLAKAEPA